MFERQTFYRPPLARGRLTFPGCRFAREPSALLLAPPLWASSRLLRHYQLHNHRKCLDWENDHRKVNSSKPNRSCTLTWFAFCGWFTLWVVIGGVNQLLKLLSQRAQTLVNLIYLWHYDNESTKSTESVRRENKEWLNQTDKGNQESSSESY